jgi:hypothetical protein
MITSKSIANIALTAALLLSNDRIDASTANWIGAAAQRALEHLEEGAWVDNKSLSELLEAEKILTRADRAPN